MPVTVPKMAASLFDAARTQRPRTKLRMMFPMFPLPFHQQLTWCARIVCICFIVNHRGQRMSCLSQHVTEPRIDVETIARETRRLSDARDWSFIRIRSRVGAEGPSCAVGASRERRGIRAVLD